MTLTVLLAVAVAIVMLAFVLSLVNLALYRPAPDGAANEVLVSICVPARNEESNLEPCVRSILAQEHRALEVLVYDDQSTDATPLVIDRLIAEDPRVRRVPTEALLDGWNGKQWGCDRMGRAARGEWLLFTDADVRFERSCIGRTLAEVGRREVALVSTFPRQMTGSIGESLVIPMIHFILLSYLPLARMRSTTDPATSAGCGQFLFIRRGAWQQCGGHSSFRGSMHDGIMLPRAVRREGLRSDLFDGTDLCSVRMYRGFGATWRGFTKNAFEGLGSFTLLVVITVMHLLGHLFPWGFLGWAVATGEATAAQWTLAGIAIALPLLQRQILAARFRQSRLSALLHPVGIALMTAIQWRSWWLHRTGRRGWKGRSV